MCDHFCVVWGEKVWTPFGTAIAEKEKKDTKNNGGFEC